VILHGDFGPGNVLLAEDGSTVGLDPALDTVGPPELDLARYVAVLSGSIRFCPELPAPPLAAVRRRFVGTLLGAYYTDEPVPSAFDLHLLGQLARRWCRLRELARQNERPALLSTRLRIIDAQLRRQLRESARRLVP
jgi:aminoglycoside phosphotransferase (APT) family kinase protein